jgi:hypothetical protein
MEIRHRQQLGLALGEPFGAGQPLALGTMPITAGVVGDANEAAILAPLDMAAKSGGPTRLDRAHDATLDASYVPGMRLATGVAVAAEDLRHLQP